MQHGALDELHVQSTNYNDIDRVTLTVMRSRVGAIIVSATFITACLLLQVTLPPSSHDVVSSPAGLEVRTIVAYSLEVQLKQHVSVAACETPVRQPSKPPQGTWQSLGSDIFLLNAYLDTRVTVSSIVYPHVRVVAMLYGNVTSQLFCQVWMDGGDVEVSRVVSTEIWSSKWHVDTNSYRPFLLSCPLSQYSNKPRAVSLVRDDACGKATTLLPVTEPAPPQRPNAVAVCVKGLDFVTDRSIRLVEWLETIRLLGASKISMYVYHVHPNMTRVLEYYRGLGEIEVIPLTLPGRQPNNPLQRTKYFQKNIWQKRQNELVSYNDCLYRNLNYQFILPLDVDEIIVPVQSNNWKQMFKQIYQKYPEILSNYASISVQNAYFFDEFGPSLNNIPRYLHMLRHIERSSNFSPAGESVKSFVSTSKTLTVFNHYALQALYPAIQARLILDTDLAQMNHYQSKCSPLLEDCVNYFIRFHKTDRILAKFQYILQAKATSVLKNLNLIYKI